MQMRICHCVWQFASGCSIFIQECMMHKLSKVASKCQVSLITTFLTSDKARFQNIQIKVQCLWHNTRAIKQRHNTRAVKQNLQKSNPSSSVLLMEKIWSHTQQYKTINC